MRNLTLAGSAVSSLALTTVSVQAQRKAASSPRATYWMSAETTSGMAAGVEGGVVHNLKLQLGSPIRAPGQPSAGCCQSNANRSLLDGPRVRRAGA
jgi:hypothetical protein